MLKRFKAPQSSGAKPAQQHQQTLRALQADMHAADDHKIRLIVGLSEASPDSEVWQTVLQPLRPRLANLRPVRALRFTRLLFIPLDDLLVPARGWRSEHATVPRTVLQAISDVVRTELGPQADAIDQLIAGQTVESTEILTRAGTMLWAPAGEILAQAPPTKSWGPTGLPPAAYPPLARAIATVLRRAALIHSILREAEVGVLEPNAEIVSQIVSNLATEPREGCGMIFKIILGRFPHAASLLRRITDQFRNPAETILFRAAMDSGIESVLDDMEGESKLMKSIRDGALDEVGGQVKRMTVLLHDIGTDQDALRHRPRLRGIREKLDGICQVRFKEGMQAGLTAPLAAASAPIDPAGQADLESCARALRTVEMAGRKVGNPATYDALLSQAGGAVAAASDSGNLTPIRAIRLVEILSGADAAEAMYKRTRQKQVPA